MSETKTYIAPSLLQPDNHAVLLIYYQYLQLITARSHDPAEVVSEEMLLAQGAKLFKVPILLLTERAIRLFILRTITRKPDWVSTTRSLVVGDSRTMSGVSPNCPVSSP